MFRIGTCGWAYGAWKSILYPQDAAREEMLSLYVQSFQTVEINNTFYRLPEEETVRRWREKAPAGFLFALGGRHNRS